MVPDAPGVSTAAAPGHDARAAGAHAGRAAARYAGLMPALRVDVWSDIACPWCYVGKRRLEAAIARLPEGAVEVVWRAFELDPAAPRVRSPATSYAARLARKYGRTIAEAEAMIDRMTGIAAADGLTLRFDRIRPGNTFDAHRLLRLARERGVQGRVKERLFRAYLTEGEAIGEPEVLVRLGAEAGLEPGAVREALAGEAHAADVRADEQEASRLGIHAVPFFVLGGKYGVSGAQPVEVLVEALTAHRDA
jgi:predicted DsbA family dithiol-disulfide isomerase